MASDIAHWHMADVVGLMWHYPMSACGPCGRAWHIDVVDCVAQCTALHYLKAEGELHMLISGLTVLGLWAKLKPFMGPHGVRYAIILRWIKAQDWLETCFITCRSSPVKPKTHDHECSICGLEFAIAQALGDHMRRHKAGYYGWRFGG